jgi:hypothetical protein
MSKDYYKILGVQEDADELVIRAAYQALLKRYNLDDWKGDKQKVIKILADINEAYSVLKDRYERLEYNASKTKIHQEILPESVKLEIPEQEINSAWKVACGYYSDLDILYSNLFNISQEVALNFKLIILSSKDYSNRNKLAADLELIYLKTQFGDDDDLIQFGKELIFEGAKEAVAELHQIYKVMGNSVHAQEVIDKLSEKYKSNRYLLKIQQIQQGHIEQEEKRKKQLIEAEQSELLHQRQAAEARLKDEQDKKIFWVVTFVILAGTAFMFWFSSNKDNSSKTGALNKSTVNQTVNKIDKAYYNKPITLVGLLSEREGIDCCTNGAEKKINYPVLILATPIDVVPQPNTNESDEPPELSVRHMQLVLSPSIYEEFEKNRNARAAVKCSLFHAINGHHLTSVLCDVLEVQAIK